MNDCDSDNYCDRDCNYVPRCKDDHNAKQLKFGIDKILSSEYSCPKDRPTSKFEKSCGLEKYVLVCLLGT